MSKVRRVPAKDMPAEVRSHPAEPLAESVPPSLPLAAPVDPTQPPSNELTLASASRHVRPVFRTIPKNSLMRKKAMAILAMRLAGHTTDEIAADLQITSATIRQYMYVAGKQGWISRKGSQLPAPEDQIEYQLAHKVVRNLDEMLDSPDPEIRNNATLETAKGTIFKKFDQSNEQLVPPSMVLAIKIEIPAGAPAEMREGTIGGKPRWIDAEVIAHD